MSNYGELYWVVKTKEDLIYMYADRIEIKDGVLLMITNKTILTAFNKDCWEDIFPASAVDGSEVNIDKSCKLKDIGKKKLRGN